MNRYTVKIEFEAVEIEIFADNEEEAEAEALKDEQCKFPEISGLDIELEEENVEE